MVGENESRVCFALSRDRGIGRKAVVPKFPELQKAGNSVRVKWKGIGEEAMMKAR